MRFDAEFMGRTRARWAVEEKRRIVELTLEPGASVARVAQAEGVNANQVFQWRRTYRDGVLPSGGASTALLPVVIGTENGSMPEIASTPEVPQAGPDEACPVQPSGAIHIEFPGLASISVERGADRALLRVILESVRK